MPFVRIDISSEFPGASIRPMADVVHHAMVEAIGIPIDDRFQVVAARPDAMIYDRGFQGVDRSDTMIMIEIHLAPGRSIEKKQELYKAIAQKISALGHRPEDILIHLLETPRENWSFGNGVAHYVERPPAHLAALSTR